MSVVFGHGLARCFQNVDQAVMSSGLGVDREDHPLWRLGLQAHLLELCPSVHLRR